TWRWLDPLHVTVEVCRPGMPQILGVLALGLRNRRVGSMPRHHYRFLRQRVEVGNDRADDRLQVTGGRGLAGAALKQGVAADQRSPDAQTDAAGRMAGSVQHRDPFAADLDLLSVAQPAIDPFRRDVDFLVAHQDRRLRRRGYGLEQGLLVERHVYQQRVLRFSVVKDVGVIAVRAHRPDLHDAEAVLG